MQLKLQYPDLYSDDLDVVKNVICRVEWTKDLTDVEIQFGFDCILAVLTKKVNTSSELNVMYDAIRYVFCYCKPRLNKSLYEIITVLLSLPDHRKIREHIIIKFMLKTEYIEEFTIELFEIVYEKIYLKLIHNGRLIDHNKCFAKWFYAGDYMMKLNSNIRRNPFIERLSPEFRVTLMSYNVDRVNHLHTTIISFFKKDYIQRLEQSLINLRSAAEVQRLGDKSSVRKLPFELVHSVVKILNDDNFTELQESRKVKYEYFDEDERHFLF